jgi:hypothetical protein
MVGGPPDLSTGPDGVRALFATLGEITQTWQIDDVIAEGDKMVVRDTNRCVQDSFFGVSAAGVEQVFTAMFIFQFAERSDRPDLPQRGRPAAVAAARRADRPACVGRRPGCRSDTTVIMLDGWKPLITPGQPCAEFLYFSAKRAGGGGTPWRLSCIIATAPPPGHRNQRRR